MKLKKLTKQQKRIGMFALIVIGISLISYFGFLRPLTFFNQVIGTPDSTTISVYSEDSEKVVYKIDFHFPDFSPTSSDYYNTRTATVDAQPIGQFTYACVSGRVIGGECNTLHADSSNPNLRSYNCNQGLLMPRSYYSTTSNIVSQASVSGFYGKANLSSGSSEEEISVVSSIRDIKCTIRQPAECTDGEMNDFYCEAKIDVTSNVDQWAGYTSGARGSFLVTFYKAGYEPSNTYYRFENNQCSLTTLKLSEKTINDYLTRSECEENIEIPEEEPEEEEPIEETPQNQNLILWIIGIIVFAGILLFIYLKTRK